MGGFKEDFEKRKNTTIGMANNHEENWPGIMPPQSGFLDGNYGDLLGQVVDRGLNWLNEVFDNGEQGKSDKTPNPIEKLGPDEYLKTYPVSRSNHYRSAPRNRLEVMFRLHGNHQTGKPLSKEEEDWCKTYFIIQGQADFAQTYEEYAKDEKYLHPIRSSIVSTALAMNGTVNAELPSGEIRNIGGRKVKTCKGCDTLLQFYQDIAPQFVSKEGQIANKMDSTINVGDKSPGNNRRESWCGIFALWVHNKAGNGKSAWPPSFKDAKPEDKHGAVPLSEDPKPGDIAYNSAKGNHYGIVISVKKDQVVTLEGNSAMYSGIYLKTRPKRSYWQTYFRAIPKSMDFLPYL